MVDDPRACEHCGNIACKVGVCWRIKSIEYFEDGITTRKIEYHAPQPLAICSPPGNTTPIVVPSNWPMTTSSTAED